jgi:hypothetical protein
VTPLAVLALIVLTGQTREIVLRHDGDYGPYGGDGPSFHLVVSRTGEVQLSAHRWLCADGQYEGQISSADTELLYSMFEDLKSATSSPPPFWICPHAPAFWVMEAPTGGAEPFVTNSCVSAVATSPLARFYAFARRVAVAAEWTSFTPATAAPTRLEPQLIMLRPLPIRRKSPWR